MTSELTGKLVQIASAPSKLYVPSVQPKRTGTRPIARMISGAQTAPFARTVLAIDAERARFAERGFATATVEIASVLAGKPRIERKATLRATDADAGTTVTVYHDRDEPLALRVSWYGADRTVVGQLEPLASDYLFLTPPAPVAPPAPQPGGGRTARSLAGPPRPGCPPVRAAGRAGSGSRRCRRGRPW